MRVLLVFIITLLCVVGASARTLAGLVHRLLLQMPFVLYMKTRRK